MGVSQLASRMMRALGKDFSIRIVHIPLTTACSIVALSVVPSLAHTVLLNGDGQSTDGILHYAHIHVCGELRGYYLGGQYVRDNGKGYGQECFK